MLINSSVKVVVIFQGKFGLFSTLPEAQGKRFGRVLYGKIEH